MGSKMDVLRNLNIIDLDRSRESPVTEQSTLKTRPKPLEKSVAFPNSREMIQLIGSILLGKTPSFPSGSA